MSPLRYSITYSSPTTDSLVPWSSQSNRVQFRLFSFTVLLIKVCSHHGCLDLLEAGGLGWSPLLPRSRGGLAVCCGHHGGAAARHGLGLGPAPWGPAGCVVRWAPVGAGPARPPPTSGTLEIQVGEFLRLGAQRPQLPNFFSGVLVEQSDIGGKVLRVEGLIKTTKLCGKVWSLAAGTRSGS